MQHDVEWNGIGRDAAALDASAQRLHWSLARTPNAGIQRWGADQIEHLKASNPWFARALDAQVAKTRSELIADETRRRNLDAQVSRHLVTSRLRPLQDRVGRFVTAIQQDCTVTAPGALAGLGPKDRLQTSLLRELRRPYLERSSPAELLSVYRAALAMGNDADAAALVDLQLVEELASRKTAGTMEQAPAARELRDVVKGIQELRVPTAITEIESTIRAAQTALSHADLVGLHPASVDPERDPAAKAAHQAASIVYLAETKA